MEYFMLGTIIISSERRLLFHYEYDEIIYDRFNDKELLVLRFGFKLMLDFVIIS